ncbi:MAG: hypothetical protein WEF53_04300 [Bacteroidota bacterium]
MNRLLLTVVVLAFSCGDVYSRQSRGVKYWATVGAGLTFAERLFANGLGVAFSYKPGGIHFSARFVAADRVPGYLFDGKPPLDYLQDLSVLVGVSQEDENTIFVFSAGPGLVNGKFNEAQNNRRFSVTGLSLEAQAILKLGKSVGVGAYLFSNINKEASYVGILLSIQVGHFRNW